MAAHKTGVARLLFITSGPIGDCILSTGALEHARALLGGAPAVTIACGPAAAELFRAAPGLEQVLPIVKRPLAGHWFDLWRRLAVRRFDLAIDLRGSLVARVLPVQRRIIGRPSGEGHKCRQMARLFGLETPLAPRLHLDSRAWAEGGRLGEPTLVLGPGGKFPGKRWPAQRFVDLGRRLGLPVVVLGSREEAAMCSKLAAALGGQSRAGELDLLASAALLSQAALFVGNDSGLMHLAAAAGAPTLGLFGPSDETVYGPFGPKAMALRGPTPYAHWRSAGWDETAPGSLLEDLQVEAVEAAARQLWEPNHA